MIATLSWGSIVQAAELKVLASNSVRTMLEDIAPLFTRASGHKVTLGFGTSSQVAKRVLSGEPADLLVVTPDVVDELTKAGKLAPGASVAIARSLMGVGVRAGAPWPDIGTPAALRATLLAVKAVTSRTRRPARPAACNGQGLRAARHRRRDEAEISAG